MATTRNPNDRLRLAICVALLALSAAWTAPLAAQAAAAATVQSASESNLERSDGAEAAAAPAGPTIADFAWLQGHWRGDGLGGVVEEVWLPPAGGSMAGVFRAVAGDAVSLYEIFTISEPDLALRLKHFHADVTGWEEREEVVTFPLVRVTPDEAVFEGLAFRRVGADGLQAVVRVGSADGSESDLELSFRRVGGEPGGGGSR